MDCVFLSGGVAYIHALVFKTLYLLIACLIGATVALGQPLSFAERVYPVLEKAGCRACHNAEGVASPTRLHFPEKDVSAARIEAFGKSLVELVDRSDPEKSPLLLKPTARVTHAGGERIPKASPEEATLRSWIKYLAGLSGAELTSALQYKQREAMGYGEVPEVVLRRLTHSQYNNTVHDLLRDSTNPSKNFPPEDFVNGFKNQYQNLSISPILAEAYSRSAERLAANAFRRGDSRGLIPCEAYGIDDAPCRKQFIEQFGRRAFRRPLEPAEVAHYDSLFKRQENFLRGAQTVIEAMLQVPSFLFWLEDTPKPALKPYASASQLSYFLWNTTPDEALLEAAAKGELNTPEGVEKVARRMLADPKARQGVDEFVAQWLRFDRVLGASRERRVYPLFNERLAEAMTEEAKRFIGNIVWNDRDFREVFNANYTFINSDLAAVYGMNSPARDWDRVEFTPESERAGIFGQALFLTSSSKPDDTAPTGRGLFVREQFLCQEVPNPPPGVDTNLPPFDEAKPVTNRGRLAMHASNKVCASCHNLIDPIGFGFEKFDAIGMRREQYKLVFNSEGPRRGRPKEVLLDLDTSAWVTGIPNSEFTSPKGLGELLAQTPQCHECVVKQLFRYMAGRLDTPADRPVINRALERFRDSGFRFKELVISLVTAQVSPPARRNDHGSRNR
jgi:hypothetical protein